METCTYGLGEGNRKSAAVLPEGADYLSHLEAPYHNILFMNLCKKGFNVKYEFPLPVFYEGDHVGKYYADLLINNKIIIEIKSVKSFSKAHISQVLNYLSISKCRLGFLVNFLNPSVEFKRLVL